MPARCRRSGGVAGAGLRGRRAVGGAGRCARPAGGPPTRPSSPWPAARAAEDRIEAELAAWSAGWDAVELPERLQPAIPCGPVLAPARLHTDPQVRHGSIAPLRHSVMGEVPYDGVAAVLSATPARLTRAAPCLGEDTFTVLTELIGMDPDEVAQLLADGVVEITG
ncbi:MAG: CoA transferase [Acidimicrobiales bacterium]